MTEAKGEKDLQFATTMASTMSRAGLAASEVFPDLHHKMSKKIAQLTKVIYHLHTKNDDFNSEKQALQQEHESEIESGLAPPPARPNACVRCVALARRLFCVATTLTPPKNSGWSAAEWAPNLKQRRTLAS